MRFLALLLPVLVCAAQAGDTGSYYDWSQDALSRMVPESKLLEVFGVSSPVCPAEPFSAIVTRSISSRLAREAIRGMYLYGTDCWAEALKSRASSYGVYGCKNGRKTSGTAQSDSKYARFMSVHFNAAAECLGVKNYRKLLFGEMLKESTLQLRIEGGGDALGPFQMTSVAFEDLIQKRNDIGVSTGQKALTSRLNRSPPLTPRAESPACRIFGTTDRTLLAAKKNPSKLLGRLRDPCDSLNGGENTSESQASPLYLGMLYNAYQIALIEEKVESLGVGKKLGWVLRDDAEPGSEFCDRFIPDHRASCVQVIETVVAIGHNVGGPSAMAALETAVKSKIVQSTSKNVAQKSDLFSADITRITALGKGLAERSETRKLVALTYYNNPSIESQRKLEQKLFGHEIKGSYRPGIVQELEQIEKSTGAQCF